MLYVVSVDSQGRDPAYNLHDGYIIQAANADQWSLIHWEKEQEEHGMDNQQSIIEGDFKKYYSDTKIIVLCAAETNYCIDKATEEIVYKTKDMTRMERFISLKYKKTKIRLEDL